jgi:putative oxidoreductase
MWTKLLATSNSLPLALLRVTLGVVMFPHGAQKMLGWFGGQGFAATMGGFEHQGIPVVFACLAILAEFLGGLGLIFGLLSRIAAFGILCNMVVAVLRVHAANGLFMNWTGTNKGEGFEYHLLAIAMAIVVMAAGAGSWSLDRWLARK